MCCQVSKCVSGCQNIRCSSFYPAFTQITSLSAQWITPVLSIWPNQNSLVLFPYFRAIHLKSSLLRDNRLHAFTPCIKSGATACPTCFLLLPLSLIQNKKESLCLFFSLHVATQMSMEPFTEYLASHDWNIGSRWTCTLGLLRCAPPRHPQHTHRLKPHSLRLLHT